MLNTLRALIFFSQALLLLGVPAHAQTFSGDWEVTVQGKDPETPYSTFELHLTQKGPELRGSYCYVTRYGDKIDCDPNGPDNLKGVVDMQANTATVTFNSFFGAEGGVAKVSLKDDKINWRVTTPPKGGEYFGPLSSTLQRSTH